ncbi:hypothetical protein [Antarctobacter heliothermus]|uniref:Uncharacterized protein n=1 Tax=Antarctobacter heliothermus TaxID=74033 RepID=A0A222DZ22_9RHOB|nr:hypothetical protein [Antarctobacter heliothermus]ASP18951.1 hypothetical protein ANTHELSMS3_00226 [Antarctobacter heliothermus]MBT53682.1 hypothetical protein [Mameliella sp.]
MKRLLLALTLVLVAPLAAQAQQLMGSYNAFIGQQDLFNSNGGRLSSAAQVLRQDRANYHRFGISQYGDDWDPYFGDINNRGRLEQLVNNGGLPPYVANAIMGGNVHIVVNVYGQNGWMQYVEIIVPG